MLLNTGCLMCLMLFGAKGAERRDEVEKHFIKSIYEQLTWDFLLQF